MINHYFAFAPRQNHRSAIPDALRGAASLAVAAAHAWQVFLLPYTGKSIGMTIMGGMATWSVAIFFMLSGILIGGSVRRSLANGSFSLKDYALARALRIYPPLLLAVAITVLSVEIIILLDLYGAQSYLLPGDLGSARTHAFMEWPYVLTTLSLTYQLVPGHGYIFFNGPLWSLSFEVWMYVFAGLIVHAITRGSLVAWLAAGALACLMFYVSRAAHPPFWVVGCVWGLGFVYGVKEDEFRDAFFRSGRILVPAALIACALIANDDFLVFLPAPYEGARQHLFYVCFSVVILFVMLRVFRSEGFERTAVCRLLAKTAEFSYTLYLVHFPLFLLSLSFFRPLLLPFGFYGALALAGASLIVVIATAAFLAGYAENRVHMKERLQQLVTLARGR